MLLSHGGHTISTRKLESRYTCRLNIKHHSSRPLCSTSRRTAGHGVRPEDRLGASPWLASCRVLCHRDDGLSWPSCLRLLPTCPCSSSLATTTLVAASLTRITLSSAALASAFLACISLVAAALTSSARRASGRRCGRARRSTTGRCA